MATAYRSSQSVTNATAGTSVTVAKPASIVDTGSNPSRDHLIAYIAAVGTPTITAPAGWTLVATAAASTSVTLAVYRKLASSEGASWTWTLGSSQRNWGWVGAYTGVDPTTPVADYATDSTLTTSTELSPDSPAWATFPADGQGVSAGAAVRAASGAATTWTHTSTERADLSTNAGAGTDIAGVVGDTVNATGADSSYAPSLTASQAQTAGVGIALTLTPYFTPYNGGALTVTVQAALGADPDGDLSLASWTDISHFVLQDQAVTIRVGRPNGTGTADSERIAFTLKNLNGEWTSPTGAYSRYLVRNLPFRVLVSGFGSASSYHRGTAFLASAKPRWDKSLRYSVVDIVAQGRLRRMQQNEQPLHSAAYRALLGATPCAYWPFEDESDAEAAASAIDGHPAATATGVTFGANSLYRGTAPLATLAAGSSLQGAIPSYAASNSWGAVFALSMPSEPALQTTLLQIFTTGTAAQWRLSVTPGTSGLVLDVLTSAGSSLLSRSVALTESDFYGAATVFTLTATKNGTGIDYDYEVSTSTGAGGAVGTIAAATAGQLSSWSQPAAAGLADAPFGHLAFYPDSATAPLTISAATAIALGNAGEWPWARFQRLCVEEGVPYNFDSSANTDLEMGPQAIDTLANLLRDCSAVEGNLMHDAGDLAGETGLFFFPARDTRDNASIAFTLDFALGQVVDGFEPTLDDQNIVNYAEASRVGGSSIVVSDTASMALEGTYKTQIQANTNSDASLRDIAGRAVGLGTIPGMRYPVIGWNLRRSPGLAQTWLAAGLDSKMAVVHPPSQYPPDQIESFIEGYVETLGTYLWSVQANLSPAIRNNVLELTDTVGDTSDLGGHLEADSCVLAGSPTSGATSTTITSTPLVTTTADDFPFDIVIDGERITVTNCTGGSNPQTITMTRSVNGVVMAHTAGDAVTLYDVLILAM